MKRIYSKGQLLVLSAISLLASYGVISRALDTGSLRQYLLAFILFILFIKVSHLAFKTPRGTAKKKKLETS